MLHLVTYKYPIHLTWYLFSDYCFMIPVAYTSETLYDSSMFYKVFQICLKQFLCYKIKICYQLASLGSRPVVYVVIFILAIIRRFVKIFKVVWIFISSPFLDHIHFFMPSFQFSFIYEVVFIFEVVFISEVVPIFRGCLHSLSLTYGLMNGLNAIVILVVIFDLEFLLFLRLSSFLTMSRSHILDVQHF